MEYRNDVFNISFLDLPWDKLCGCNILITGATGLIGSCLVEALMLNPKKDYHIYATGRNEERARKRFAEFEKDASFHFVCYDVIHPLQTDIDYHYIIHAASNASPNFFSEKPVEVIKSNINGLDNLMVYGLNHNLKRFLFISSGEIYGEGDGQIFTENYSGYVDCISPRSCYPSSKRAAETLCVSYMAEYGVDAVIARPCHIYGPNFTESDNRVYAQFIRNVLQGENIVMKSHGEQFRSWCYVVDCASALLYILLKGECGQAYNIADDKSNISIRELAELVADIVECEVIMNIPMDMEKRGYNPVAKSIFSIAKLEALGWCPLTHISKGMEKTINHLRYH
ncbi:MAG: NAD-dependent epimerase/dehydratase family protein [Bacteroides sp.]|nr:NAD-dependent epimerase/dehydratase family protein [Bacteroides sp.]